MPVLLSFKTSTSGPHSTFQRTSCVRLASPTTNTSGSRTRTRLKRAIQHWAYDIWFKDRVADEPPENIANENDLIEWKRYQSELGLVEFSIDDNPLADPRDIQNIKTTYAGDPEGWARFVEGKWVAALGSRGLVCSRLQG